MREKFRSREAAMPFIMLAVLIDMAAIGIIIPVLPALVGSFATSQAEQAYWYGVVAVAFGVSHFLASPVLGALSDRYGRRPVLLLSTAEAVAHQANCPECTTYARLNLLQASEDGHSVIVSCRKCEHRWQIGSY